MYRTTLRLSPLAALAILLSLASCSPTSGVQPEQQAAAPEGAVMAPRFEVDPMWPKPLPNHWVLGTIIGVDVDADDNVWIIHRNTSLDPKEIYATWDPPASDCCSWWLAA